MASNVVSTSSALHLRSPRASSACARIGHGHARRNPNVNPSRLPLALRVAQFACALPDFPGRDTLLQVLRRRSRWLNARVRGTFARGLKFEGNLATDDNILDFFLLRFSRPALSGILDAALRPGSVFADVGANLGMYTLWAAPGRCFRPGPRLRARAGHL